MTTQPSSPQTPFGVLRMLVRDWGGWLTLGTIAFTLVYAAIMISQLGDPDTRVFIADLGTPLVTLVAVILALRAGSHPGLDRRTRWGWYLIGLAFLANGLGSVAWFVYESLLQVYPELSWADVGWLAFYPFLIGALVLFPTAPRGRHERATFWLDATTVLLGGGMLVWYFSIGPRAAAEHTSSLALAVSLAYPVGDLVLIFAIITIALSRPDPRSAWPLRIIGLGLLFNIAANLGYAYMMFDGSYQSGMWPSAGWALAFCICALGGQWQYMQASRRVYAVTPTAPGGGSINILPYIGIGIGYALLLGVTYQYWVRPLADLILGAGALTGVVIIRQVIAVRENVRLAAERNAATQASQLKSEFLANMSHELRTPLNSIINFTRIVSSGVRGPVTPDQLDYLNRVRHSGEHLLGLINDILDLSKIEVGRMELEKEPLQIAEVVQSVMPTAAGLTKDKPIQLRQDIEADLPVIEADRTCVRQILLNLLSNAAKFTEQGSITVRAMHMHDSLVVQVVDTGIGIAREHLGTIFEEFRQVDGGSNRRYEGTGLGLPLCRRLVELHGGRLWVESTSGAGSTFVFSLPIVGTPAPVAAVPVRSLPTPRPDGIPVLVIDDDPAAIEIASTYLSRDGYAVYGVTDSRQALDEARRLQPVAIILDVLMPHQDGWQVLSALKGDPDLHTVPVALYTVVEQQLGFYLGASAYLIKPIDETELRTTVAQLVAYSATVLVIDDDPNAREIVASHLAQTGQYRVTTAGGGQEGLERIAETRPDLIILDLMMPDVDGFTVLEHLQQQPETSAIPVIVMTAKDLSHRERTMLNQRVQGLLAKGKISPERLLEKVTELVRTTTEQPTLPA